MNKLLLPLLTVLLTAAASPVLAQGKLVSHRPSLTGLNDPEPAAPRHLLADLTYPVVHEAPDAAPAPQPASPPPAAPDNALPGTPISLTKP